MHWDALGMLGDALAVREDIGNDIGMHFKCIGNA